MSGMSSGFEGADSTRQLYCLLATGEGPRAVSNE